MTLFKCVCPGCQHSFKVQLPEGAERGKVTCPQCQTSFIVRAPAPPQSPTHPESPSPPPPPSTVEVASASPGRPVGSSGKSDLLSDLLSDAQMPAESATPASGAAIPAALQPYAPPTAAVSVATEHVCPLCGQSDKNYLVRGKMLFDHKVCRKCFHSFLNRRQLAFFIDIVIFEVVTYSISFAARFVIGFTIASATGEVNEHQLAGIELIFSVINIALYILWFLFKDGFNGTSPGKAAMGVRVINEDTGYPIGFSGSAKRNWPIVLLGFVPFAWLIIAAIMGKGYRIGDRGARTKVVWKKYQHSRVFQPNRPVSFAASGASHV